MSKLIARHLAGGEYQWQRMGEEAVAHSGDFNGLCEALGSRQTELWLLLPGEYFFIKSLAYSEREKRHLRQSIPYQLEDVLLEDIDALHFALGEPREGVVAVAACNREWLRSQLKPFQEAQIEPAWVVPEPLLLSRENGWALCLSGDSLLAHTGYGEGFAMERTLALEALKRLRAESPEETLQVSVTGVDRQRLAEFFESLQALPGLAIEKQTGPWWESLAVDGAPEIDLRQGEFGRRLPVERWWQQWRKVAVFAAITLVTYLAVSTIQYNLLQNRNLQLRQQIEQAFRNVVPRGVIVDAEKQLRSKVNALQTGGGDSAAVSTLAAIAPLIAANQDVTLRALHYSDGEMRLSFWAKSFNAIEQLRANLAGLGMDVELVQSSADGEGQQARLRVRPGVAG